MKSLASTLSSMIALLLLMGAAAPDAYGETKITYAKYNYEQHEPLVCNIGVLNPQTRDYDFIGKIEGGQTITLPPEFVGRRLQFTIVRSDGRGGIVKQQWVDAREWVHYTVRVDMINWSPIDRINRGSGSSGGSGGASEPVRPHCFHCEGKGWILYEEGERISGNQYRITKRERRPCRQCN